MKLAALIILMSSSLYAAAPVVSVGSASIVHYQPNPLLLSGTAVDDSTSPPKMILWSTRVRPDGPPPLIHKSTNYATYVTYRVTGTYVFRLTVIDAEGLAGRASQQVTIELNRPPRDVKIISPSDGVLFDISTRTTNPLIATATDDGPMEIKWVHKWGPDFKTDPNAVKFIPTEDPMRTHVQFSSIGAYRLAYEVTDGEYTVSITTDVIVSQMINYKPVIVVAIEKEMVGKTLRYSWMAWYTNMSSTWVANSPGNYKTRTGAMDSWTTYRRRYKPGEPYHYAYPYLTAVEE